MLKYVKILSLSLIFMVSSMQAKERPVYVKYVHEIVNEYVKEMKNEYGLRCIGSGGGMANDVEEVEVIFTVQKKLPRLKRLEK